MKTSFTRAAAWLLILSTGSSLAQDNLAQDIESPEQFMEGHWGFLDKHCMDCHNFEDWAGGLSLDGMGPESLSTQGDQWEEIIRKLEAGMMPPSGQARPEDHEMDSFIAALESSLDLAVAQQPQTAPVTLHRMNRSEYAYAIKEIFDLEIDPAELLPRDDVSHGFDNNASVLKISPSFLEQYVLAAREVSTQVMGKPGALPTARDYRGAPNASQNMHIDGLPLGTRGGMLIEHFFPADGEYEFTIAGLVGAGYVWGVMEEHTLIITINDEKVFEESFGGTEDLRAVDLEQAQGVAAIDDRFANIKVDVEAGHHKVGISFLARSSADIIEVLHGFVPVDGMATLVQGVSSGPRIENVTIRGPFNAGAVSATHSRDKIMICNPEQSSEERACAQQVLANIAGQAFRREVNETDLAGAMHFFDEGYREGGFDTGLQKGIMAILSSPRFLYRSFTPPEDVQPGETYAIKDLELASRLSFFLWSRQPDAELLQVASEGRLNEPAELEKQVQRMLAHPAADALVTNFAFQWLNVRGMEQIEPDRTIYPQFTYDLVPAFEKELHLFIGSLFAEDRPVTELLSARHTFINERLSLHYGLNTVRGGQFQRVELDDPQRWGLLGKGAVLMATSYPNRTSPVVRGAYILDKIIGAEAPPPPPDVEAFPEIEEGAAHITVRERLEMHRDNPACTSCHAVIDPLGLALENYTAIGQWRDLDADAGIPIDASGQLTDGRAIASPADLSGAILENPAQFAKTFTQKLMTFALGRGLEYYDMPVVRKIVREAGEEDYRLSAIVQGIVMSPAFRTNVYVTDASLDSDDDQSLARRAN